MSKKVWEVIELLEANGWQYLRTRGDHHKFKKPTYRAILREAGLK